jgi:hypothetical protein
MPHRRNNEGQMWVSAERQSRYQSRQTDAQHSPNACNHLIPQSGSRENRHETLEKRLVFQVGRWCRRGCPKHGSEFT